MRLSKTKLICVVEFNLLNNGQKMLQSDNVNSSGLGQEQEQCHMRK